MFRADPNLTPVTAGQSPLWLLAGLQAYVDGVGTLCATATRLADEFVGHLKDSSHGSMAVQFREMSQRVEAAAVGEMALLASDVQACWQQGNAGSQDDSGVSNMDSSCSFSRFPFVGARLVICHSDVRLLSLFFHCFMLLAFSLCFSPPSSYLRDLSSDNPPPPILAVVFLVFCNFLPRFFSQILWVISRLSLSPCVQHI